MSDAETSPSPRSLPPVTIQSAQPDTNQAQVAQIQQNINNLLQTASTFPVRYQPPTDLLNSESGRLALSIVRARFEKTWDIKAISAKLTEDTARSVYWIISPRKALDPVKIKKDEDDDFNFDDLMLPGKPMKF